MYLMCDFSFQSSFTEVYVWYLTNLLHPSHLEEDVLCTTPISVFKKQKSMDVRMQATYLYTTHCLTLRSNLIIVKITSGNSPYNFHHPNLHLLI